MLISRKRLQIINGSICDLSATSLAITQRVEIECRAWIVMPFYNADPFSEIFFP
jgi:hypothetical protein